MKQLKLGQFSLGRLRSYLLASERASSDAGNSIKNRFRSDMAVASRTLLRSTSSTGTPEAILKTTERRWPGTLLLSCQNNLPC